MPDAAVAGDLEESAASATDLHNVRFDILLRHAMGCEAVCGRSGRRTSVYLATALALLTYLDR